MCESQQRSQHFSAALTALLSSAHSTPLGSGTQQATCHNTLLSSTRQHSALCQSLNELTVSAMDSAAQVCCLADAVGAFGAALAVLLMLSVLLVLRLLPCCCCWCFWCCACCLADAVGSSSAALAALVLLLVLRLLSC